jgi:tetrahydromethanopterin S-methyltransferase subunit G
MIIDRNTAVNMLDDYLATLREIEERLDEVERRLNKHERELGRLLDKQTTIFEPKS